MKIQCDVCEKEEAAVYCTADEATLCDSCDHRVHHANKLASKHQRFALLHPSTTQFPLCDICQERRAYLFCQQDRAILCRECDFPIHSANELTQNHNRFLLTGVKLSATPAVYTSSADAATPSVTTAGGGPLVPDHTNNKKSKPSLKLNHSVSDSPAVSNPASISNKSSLSSSYTSMNNNNNDMDNFIINEEGSGLRSSSISEYLIQTLPGWHFEDLLDSSSVPFGFCKSSNDVISPFLDGDVETASFSPFSSESLGIWVPQATPPPPPPPLFCSSHMINNNNNYVFKDSNVKAAHKGGGLISDDVFTVPQICSRPAIISKRPRPSW